jgi:hypothetical protein
MEVMETNSSEIFNTTLHLTIIPATCETHLPLINVALLDRENLMDEGVLQFEMSVQQRASMPIGGTYTLSLESNTTRPLLHNSSALEVRGKSPIAVILHDTTDIILQIKAALEALNEIGQVSVTAPQALPHDSLGKMCPGRRFEVIFKENTGNLPLLGFQSEALFGSDLSTRLEEVCFINKRVLHYLHIGYVQVVAGGLFLRPIPGHMLQTAEITPQVTIIQTLLPQCSARGPFKRQGMHPP